MSEKGISAEQQAKAWRLENGVSPTAPSAGVWPLTNTTETFTFTLEPYWTDAKVTEYLGARLREVEGERDRAVKDKFDNIEKWIEQAGELRQDISDFIEKLRSAEEEGDRQRAALEKFGVHGSDCNYFHAWNDRNKVCDCGLDELLGKKPLKMC